MTKHTQLPNVYEVSEDEAEALFGDVPSTGIVTGVAGAQATRFFHREKETIRMKALSHQLPAVKGIVQADQLGYL